MISLCLLFTVTHDWTDVTEKKSGAHMIMLGFTSVLDLDRRIKQLFIFFRIYLGVAAAMNCGTAFFSFLK